MKKNMQPLIEKGEQRNQKRKTPIAVREENNIKEAGKEREEKNVLLLFT